MWKLNNMVQNNQWIKKEILSEIRKYFEINGNENTMYQTLQHAAKDMLRSIFAAVNNMEKNISKWYVNTF